MNEDNMEFVPAAEGDVLAAEDSAAEMDAAPETFVGEIVEDLRPFLTTSFQDYTVVEGLLLLLVLLTVIQLCIKIVKEGFWWL